MLSGDVNIVWWIGVIGDSLLSLVGSIIALVYFIKYVFIIENRKKQRYLLYSSISIISMSFYSLSVTLTYILVAMAETNLSSKDIWVTNGIWIFLNLFLAFYLLSALELLSFENRLSLVLFNISLIALFSLSFFISKYTVYWNDGIVIVDFSYKTAEIVHRYITLLICVVILFLAIYRFLQSRVLLSDEPHARKVEKKNLTIRSFWLICSSTILLVTFFLPKVAEKSFITPVNVKFIGYTIYYLFLVFILFANKTPNKLKLSFLLIQLDPSCESEINKYQKTILNNMIIVVALFAIFRILIEIVKPYINHYSNSSDAVQAKVAVYLFTFLKIKWFAHIIGFILPLIFSIVIFIVIMLIQRQKIKALLYMTSFLIGECLFSLLVNNPLVLKTNSSLTPFTFVFYIYPIIQLIFIFVTLSKKKDEHIFHLRKNQKFVSEIYCSFLSPLLVYPSTLWATIFTDFINPISVTGKILLGGDSFVDGIFVVPIISSLIYWFILLLLLYLYPIKPIKELD